MHPLPRALAIVSATLVSHGFAQQPYGNATPGVGGIPPQLSAIRPNIGDSGFELELQCVAAGSQAFTVIGLLPGQVSISGIDLLLDPVGIIAALQNTVSAQGSANFPLPVPNSTSIIGPPLFAQSIVIDGSGPFGLSASRGLRFAIGDLPNIFVACSILRGDPYHYFDVAGGTRLDTGSPTQTDNVTAAVFDEAGARLFTASSIQNLIGVGDSRNSPIQWSTLYTSSGRGCYGLHHDTVRDLLWTLTDPGTGSRELVAIDANPSSATYGRVVHNTLGVLSGNYERWSMSSSGDLAAILNLLPNALTILDTDPGSPTFLQAIHTAQPIPVDGSSPIALATQVAITPDQRYALVTLQLAGATAGEIAQFDIATGSWVDHNGSGPGQNIGALSNPPVVFGSAPTTLEISNDGRFAIVGGFGSCGWVGRLDLTPKVPTSFAWTAFTPTAPLENGWTAGLARDESEIAVATWPDSRCGALAAPQLVRIDVATGTQLGTLAIPANSNGSNQNWYTVVYR